MLTALQQQGPARLPNHGPVAADRAMYLAITRCLVEKLKLQRGVAAERSNKPSNLKGSKSQPVTFNRDAPPFCQIVTFK